jgi:hypothetical protein
MASPMRRQRMLGNSVDQDFVVVGVAMATMLYWSKASLPWPLPQDKNPKANFS